MRKTSFWRRAFASVALAAALGALPSCLKVNSEDVLPADDLLPGGFHRTVTLHEGDSYLSLELGSDSEAKLADLEKRLTLKEVHFVSESFESDVFPAVPPSAEDALEAEKYAVHLKVLESHLGEGVKGLELSLEEEAAKTNLSGTYSGGPYYFYSYDAPHYFRVTPVNGNCVSAWLYEKGSSWQFVSWAGGSGGNYLCRYSWAASSSVTSKDYRLKAVGARFSVYWY